MLAAEHELNQGGTRRRWKILATLTVAAALLHASLLGGLQFAWPGRDATPLPGSAVRVRMLAAAVTTPPAVAVATPPAVAAGTAVAPAAPQAPRAVPPRPAKPAAVPARPPREVAAAGAASAPPSAAPHDEDSEPAPPAESTALAGMPRPGGEGEIPVYRTRIPPPLTLRYEVQRGILRGSGELQWRPSGEHYQMHLHTLIAGLRVITQTSEGGFDEAGLAPLRFTDQRARRELRAANFQRDAGKITFSGPATELPLLVGAQDRLSWMIQLAAVVAAEPHRLGGSGKVAMLVVGARGDAHVWVFRYVQHEWVQTDAGPVHAAKFVREPREPYDTGVEVWLDPQRHHLPVRASMRNRPDGEGLDLLLQEVVVPPSPP